MHISEMVAIATLVTAWLIAFVLLKKIFMFMDFVMRVLEKHSGVPAPEPEWKPPHGDEFKKAAEIIVGEDGNMQLKEIVVEEAPRKKDNRERVKPKDNKNNPEV
jgi:hypothetical protein